ncbi:MAG: Crp/Fnr family transcriptional regulator [Rhizobiaceae bacterium]|nr:Crp/Fnr family transcriptional regulator [Rhizobiaceae bacterium]
MRRTAQREQGDIRIRAVAPWPAEHGEEAGHVELSAAEQADLARLAEVILFETEGSQIFLQGQPAGFLYLLADGVVRGSHTLHAGDRQIVAFYWPGDLFGLAQAGAYVNSAEAVTPCKVYRFPVRKLDAFLVSNPSIQRGFFIKAVHEIRTAQRQLIAMGRFDVPRRLAIFLLDCSGHEHYFDPATQILSIPMTRYDIADYIGTSAESVTRAMNTLEGRGLIRRVTPRALELKRADLKAFADLD